MTAPVPITKVGWFARAGSWLKGAFGFGKATEALTVGGFTYTKTAAGHLASRSYMNSPNLINEIMATGKFVPDPQGLAGAVRYDVAGGFRGSAGNWELVVNPETKQIFHFLFTSSK
ncbi:hypothetical protein [Microbulbifer spongiae]|uniref:Bacterial EndoU nuclease domain-containing protein n=1 Tax=Microbulbifer spongiae TaxID=2944933 RepID=A0ABY9EFS5_9GAMM|nr:hypothetical protein [Microbulbifer sp. MI-G]WKD51052.1 hypothetical protein M8T91_06420 [Microbulbifer sp. MI-G]